jgi:lambda family phage minor tail protein L
MTVPVSALQEAAPGAIIELFELQLNTAQHGTNDLYRFHAGTSLNNNGNVYWAGQEYLAFPIEADGFEYSGNGQLPRPKIRVSNIAGTITSLLLTLPEGLEGAKVTRIRTLARYIDAINFPGGVSPYSPDPTAEFPREIYYIDRKTIENRDAVEYELAAAFDLAGIRLPKRQCIANICQWRYRSTECSYTGPPVADIDDALISGFGSSALAVAFAAAAADLKVSAAALLAARGSFAAAANALNIAQTTYVFSEEKYDNNNYVQGSGILYPPYYLYQGVWGGADVALGQEYRVGAAENVVTGKFRIQRWVLNTDTATEQAAYDAAVSALASAESDYNTKKTAYDAALSAWQASPTYAAELEATGDKCGKRLSSCKLRFTDEFGNEGDLPFGSFPGIGTYFT